MYAVVQIAGRQYRVTPGKEVNVDRLPHKEGERISIDDVRLVCGDEGLEIGTPTTNYIVDCDVVKHSRKKKVLVVRFARRGGMRRTKGHRQDYTTLKVTSIKRRD